MPLEWCGSDPASTRHYDTGYYLHPSKVTFSAGQAICNNNNNPAAGRKMLAPKTLAKWNAVVSFFSPGMVPNVILGLEPRPNVVCANTACNGQFT